MTLANDKNPSVRLRFVHRMVTVLNNRYGPINNSLVIDLISILDA
jgi:hypothetical protein